MKPTFSPSLFPLCASVPLWFKFQICLARIRIATKSTSRRQRGDSDLSGQALPELEQRGRVRVGACLRVDPQDGFRA